MSKWWSIKYYVENNHPCYIEIVDTKTCFLLDLFPAKIFTIYDMIYSIFSSFNALYIYCSKNTCG